MERSAGMTEIQVFEARVNLIEGTAVVGMQGELNGFAQAALDQAFAQAQLAPGPVILLDFQQVGFINSTGIALIVQLLARAQKRGQTLVACALSQHYQEIFAITRLSQYIQVYPDVFTALRAINAPSEQGA
jgi:anti-sigma B factor antagonist